MKEKYHNPIITGFQNSLDRRLTVFEETDIFRIAAVVDPRFKTLWCRTNQEREEIKELVTSEMAKQTLDAPCQEDDEVKPPPAKRPRKSCYSASCPRHPRRKDYRSTVRGRVEKLHSVTSGKIRK